ncbi:MAG: hypothetical protein AAFY11_01190 [Cyanobacteria bacterium J06641_5]
MQFKPLIPTAIALALSWSAIATAGEASIRTGNMSVSTQSGSSTAGNSRVQTISTPYSVRILGVPLPTTSRSQAVNRARGCTWTSQTNRTSNSGSSVYQSQTSRVCR